MLKIVAIKLNTVSNSWKSIIQQTFHTDLKRSTTQSTFKNINAGLTRQTKKEKDSNSSNPSLFTSACLGFSCPAQASDAPKRTLVTKFGRSLGATVVVFC